ncbi:MAG: hypothetical protein QM813_04235 [Verrucomicrobiota bacterium]
MEIMQVVTALFGVTMAFKVATVSRWTEAAEVTTTGALANP